MTRKKDTECSIGQTEESTMEGGKTENKTVSEPTPQLAVKPSKVNGKTEKDFIGFKTNDHILTTFGFVINKFLILFNFK